MRIMKCKCGKDREKCPCPDCYDEDEEYPEVN